MEKGDYHGAVRSIGTDNGLLTGIVYCGHCGGRLTFNRNNTPYTVQGQKKSFWRTLYRCGRRVDDRTACAGKTTYRSDLIDERVDQVIREFFRNVRTLNKAEMLRAAMQQEKSHLAIALKQSESALKKAQKDMSALEDEAIKAVTGDGAYSVDFINTLVLKQRSTLENAKAELDRLTKEVAEETQRQSSRMVDIEQIHTWADVYEKAEFKHRRTIVAAIVERVTVRAVDDIDIELKLTAKQFLGVEDPEVDDKEQLGAP